MKLEISFLVLDYTLRGGIERFVSNMCYLLSGDNRKITIYSFHRTYDAPLYPPPPQVEVIYITDIKFNRLYKFSTLYASWKFSRKIKNINDNHILISTSPIITIVLFFINNKLLKRLIASEHSTYDAHLKIVSILRLHVYKNVLATVTQTKHGVNKFLAANIPCQMIPNPATSFNDSRQWKIEIRQNRFSKFNCLSIGRFEKVKQFPDFIEAAKIVYRIYPSITYTLVGSGSEDTRLRMLVEGSGIKHVFQIHTNTPAVNEFYCSSDLYIISSASEAFPMTAIEALSFGVPIISYNKLVGPSEIIRNGYNGYLVRQNSPKAIADKIIEIYENNNLLHQMKINAINSARQYSPAEIARMWNQIL